MASKGKFQDKIRSELDDIIVDRDLLNLQESKRYGKAFEYWCLELVGQWHNNLDNDPAVLPDSGDGGVDILLEDSAGNRFIVAQCAYVGKKSRFDIDKWKRLANLADDLLDEERMLEGAYAKSAETREELVRVARRMKESGASVDLIFMTTADATDEHKATAEALTLRHGPRGLQVRLWDQLELRRIREEVDSADAEAIEQFVFDVPTGQYFSLESGRYEAHVLSISAAAIAQKYDMERQKMLAWNIRSYLGSNSINSEIRHTAEERPDEFFLCNNGITAISRTVRLEKTGRHTRVVCEKFQVINGGQTMASLAEVYRNPKKRSLLSDIPILFTIVQSKDASPTSPFNRRIIQARNTQNKVLLSDFRSNDAIQLWLERELPQRAASLLPASGLEQLNRCRTIHYKPKRDFRRKPSALKIQLEDLAKIRYAYLYEPWTVLAYVNQLWTRAGEEQKDQPGKRGEGIHDRSGKYEMAFGSEETTSGETRSWTDAELEHALFAIVIHEFAKVRIKGALEAMAEAERAGETPDHDDMLKRSYLTRSRFHIVALAGEAYRNRSRAEIRKLLQSPAELLNELDKHWRRCMVVFKAIVSPKIEEIGRDSILRSPGRWNEMVKLYAELQAM